MYMTAFLMVKGSNLLKFALVFFFKSILKSLFKGVQPLDPRYYTRLRDTKVSQTNVVGVGEVRH